MTTPDASAVAQLALRLHLVTDEQLSDCWDEVSPGVMTSATDSQFTYVVMPMRL